MRQITGPFLLALSLVLALGCGRERESDRVVVEPQADTGTAAKEPSATQEPSAALETRDPEIPSQRVEIVEPEPGPDRAAELDARERELARRQAELDARERRQRAEVRQPKPAPVEQPAPAPAAPAPEEQPEAPEAIVPVETVETVESVPAGTILPVEFQDSLSSQTSKVGDTFRARIASNIVSDDGQVAIPAGSEVVGVVGEAVPLRKVGGQAKLTLRLTDLVLPSGSTVPLHASFVGQGRSETGKDAATIGGAAAGGAILGRVLSKGNRSRGAVIGAIIGAAAGTAIASRTAGEEVTIARGTVLDVKLDREVEVRLRR